MTASSPDQHLLAFAAQPTGLAGAKEEDLDIFGLFLCHQREHEGLGTGPGA